MQDTTREARLAALDQLGIMDTDRGEMWQRIVRLASRQFNTPIALFSLLDDKRQWFKAKVGLDADETPLDQAFCLHAVEDDDILVVEDAQSDDRFRDNPLVTGHPDIRFYAGAPVHGPTGTGLGTLCVIDTKPRKLGPMKRQQLRDMADHVENLLSIRAVLHSLVDEGNLQERQEVINDVSHELMTPLTPLLLEISKLRHVHQDEVTTNSLDRMERAVQRIRDTVRQAAGSLD